MNASNTNPNVKPMIRAAIFNTFLILAVLVATQPLVMAAPMVGTAATVNSISISGSPGANAPSVNFSVNFNVDVENVTSDDFAITATGTVNTGSLAIVVGSSTGDPITVTVNGINGTGTIRLDLLSSNDIASTDDPTAVPAFSSGAVHNVDMDDPLITSNALSGSTAKNATSVSYAVEFNENVTNVNSSDFELISTGGVTAQSITVTGSDQNYTVTFNTVSGTGTMGLRVKSNNSIQDNAGNDLSLSQNHQSTIRDVDTVRPTVTSIVLVGSPAVNAGEFSYTVTFSESVTNVTSAGFALSIGSGTFQITPVENSGNTQFTVAVTLTEGTGTLKLNVTGSITDDAQNVVVAYTSGPTRQVDVDPPSVTSITVVGTPASNATTVEYLVQFDENAKNISLDDFTLGGSGVLGSLASVKYNSGGSLVPITDQTSTNEVTVTVTDIFGGGTIGVNMRSNTNIVDALGNGNNNNGYVAAFTGNTHGIDNASPSDFTVTIIPDLINIGSTPTIPQGFSLSGAEVGTSMRYSIASYDPVTLASQGSFTILWSEGENPVRLVSQSDFTVNFPDGLGAALDEGIIVLDIFLVDDNNNTGRKVDTLLMDLTRPLANRPDLATESDLGLSSTDNITSDNTPTFNGITEKNSTVVVKNGANTIGTVTADATGAWSITSGQLADGPHSISVVVTDPAGNVSQNPEVLEITIDTSKPASPSLALASGSDTGIQGNNITSVTSPTFEGTTIANGSVQLKVNGTIKGTDLADNQGAWSFTLAEVLNPGTYTIEAIATSPAGRASDASSISVTVNTSAPTVTISSTETSPTNSATIPVRVTFSEAVTGFTLDDVSVTGATKNTPTFAGSEAVYTFDITASGEGSIVVNIAAGVATDLAGNQNVIANEFGITYDITPPTVVINSIVASPTSTNPIPVSMIFSEPVTGFTANDLVILRDNEALQTLPIINFNGSGNTYTFFLAPTNNGEFTISLPTASVTDIAGNDNVAATPFSITYSTVSPIITITDNIESPSTNISPISITLTFSIAVTGFDQSDLDVTGGAISNFAGSGMTYTFTLTPEGDGELTIDVAAGVAEDEAGNKNIPAERYSIVYDTQSPTVVIGSRANNPTNISPVPISFIFNEPVVGFNSNSFTVTSGTLGTISGSGSEYTVPVVPSVDTLLVKMNEGGVTDVAGNPVIVGNQYSIVYDIAKPVAKITSSQGNPTNARNIPIRVAFNEIVTGFTAQDLNVTGGVVDNFAGSDSIYTFIVRPPDNGEVTVDIGASVAVDKAGNLNSASTRFSITYDQTLPSAVISSEEPSPTNSNLIPVSITFNERVVGFGLNKLNVTNGTAINLVNQDESGITYTFDLVPEEDGDVLVDMAAGAVTDLAGNGNVTVSPFSIVFDSTAPTAVITSTEADLTNLASIPMSISFNENITDLNKSDLKVTGAVVQEFFGADRSYTFKLIPSGDGEVVLRVTGGAFIDLAGNANLDLVEFKITYDATPPTAVISSSTQGPTNTSPIPVNILFSEQVVGFNIGDLKVAGATVSNLSGAGLNYTFDLLPNADGQITVDLPQGVVTDNAGNGNNAATQFSITYDAASSPTVVISSTATDPTRTSPIPVSVTFNESVTGFETSDLVISGGTASNLTGSGANYTFDLVPATSGLIRINIPSSVVVDNVGNGNLAADQFTITYDISAPIPSITSTVTTPTNISPIPVKVTFDKAVNGFSEDDIVVSGGSISNFQGAGASYSFDFTPSSDGEMTVNIPADIANDALGNINSAAETLSLIYDATPPVPVFTSTETSPTGKSPIPITVSFGEVVTGFVQNDLIVNGGTISGFTGTGSSYSFNISPANAGEIAISIAEGSVADLAGNTNANNDPFSIVYAVSNATQIISFSVPQATTPVVIGQGIITFEVADGTDVSGLVPSITVSENATISPESGVARNFSQPVTYTVTAENRTTVQVWTVSLVNGTVLGIATEMDIQIYPNPVNDYLVIPLASIDNAPVTIAITDMSGQQIKSWQVTQQHEVRLDVREYQAGIYLLSIAQGDQLSFARFIKF